MKRWISLLLCMAVLFALTACGGDRVAETPPATQTTPAAEDTATPAPDPTPEPTGDPSAEGGKVLVAYYSATNRTEAVAQTIADAMGGDLFELVPVQPYTSNDLDWTNDDSRVSREHNDPALQDRVELEKATPDNWADYDTVFIGYPIWWGIAAWPVNQFVTQNDFEGKTVIPFCTSASSGLGQSGTLLAELAGEGTWLEGVRFRSSVDAADVEEWVNSLGL